MAFTSLCGDEFRHVRYFVAVGEALSFTNAAQKLRLAAVPQSQGHYLEDEISVRLLDRSDSRVALPSCLRGIHL